MNRLLRQLWPFRGWGLQADPPRPARAPAPPADSGDLGDTSRCPLGVRCTCCGHERDDLVVRAFDLAAHAFDLDTLGVTCLTLCPTCAASTVSLRVGLDDAVTLVLRHAEHVGADVATEKLLQRWYYHDGGGVICRPRAAQTGPRCTSSSEGTR